MTSRPVVTRTPDQAPAFAALGDATRLAIVNRLSDGAPRSITRLTQETDISRQGVTKHLRVLERAGLLASDRVGREIRFTLEPKRIDAARACLDDVSRRWDDALARLKAFVEE